MVRNGATLPEAPGANSTTESTPALLTHRSPAASNATPYGLLNPVSAPEMVVAGVASPRASGAYSVMVPPVPLATTRPPSGAKASQLGPWRPVSAPVIV